MNQLELVKQHIIMTVQYKTSSTWVSFTLKMWLINEFVPHHLRSFTASTEKHTYVLRLQ